MRSTTYCTSIVVLTACSLLSLTGCNPGGHPTGNRTKDKALSANPISNSSQPAEFEEAITLMNSQINQKDFASAYDTLLVAARIVPSDPRLFEQVMTFVERGKESKDEEAMTLAEDLLDRSESLVHYQSVKNVQSARKRLKEVRERFHKTPSPNPVVSDSPFEPIQTLLKVSQNVSMPLGMRTKAAEQARNALDDAILELALSAPAESAKVKSDEIKRLQNATEQAEKQCLESLFQKPKSAAEEWLKAAITLVERSKKDPPEPLPGFLEDISRSISQGFDRLQEITPYSKSEAAGSVKLYERVDNQIKSLRRLKDWVWNQDVLRLLREVESAKPKPKTMDLIRRLAEVDQEPLHPYVIKRYNQVWENLFETLGSEEEKVRALRLQILHVKE